ncbi:hypothetical protein ECP03047775_4705, partial [Escherichia coli P0304777.5]
MYPFCSYAPDSFRMFEITLDVSLYKLARTLIENNFLSLERNQ